MDTEDKEPIYELAVECERLFEKQTSTLRDNGEPSNAKLLEEYQHQFATWAAFLGVFAEPKVCLDRRLRHHGDIQDLVLRLLDLLKRNLKHSKS